MNELHLLMALRLMQREMALGNVVTKADLARIMDDAIGGPPMFRVYLREIDFMITARYLTSFDHHQLQVTPAGHAHLKSRVADMAWALQMVTRTW